MRRNVRPQIRAGPPTLTSSLASPASRRWVYVSDIFPTRTRHYGLATASASQWLFSTFVRPPRAMLRSFSPPFSPLRIPIRRGLNGVRPEALAIPELTPSVIPPCYTIIIDFVVAKVTPTLETDLGYKLFLMFATINIGGMAVFSLWVPFHCCCCCCVPAGLRHARSRPCSCACVRFVG